MNSNVFIATFKDKTTGKERELEVVGFGDTYSKQFDNASDKAFGMARNECFSTLKDA